MKHPLITPRKGEKPEVALKRIVVHLCNLYEAGDDCVHPDLDRIVTDQEYDVLFALFLKVPSDTHAVATPSDLAIDPDANTIKHNPPLTSISKANGDDKEKTLADWLGQYNGPLVKALKRDGVACAIYYRKGKLVAAGLRPRGGIEGEDVTANVKFVESIPETLPEKVDISIRGELECRISTFEKINAQLAATGKKTYANPRNYTAGSIRQFKRPQDTAARQLSFTAYCIEWQGSGNPPYKTEYERALWCAKTLKIPHVRIEKLNRKTAIAEMQALEDLVPDLDYEVDGAVLSVDNLEDAEQLGRHGNRSTGNPKGKLAWKFKEQSAIVTVDTVDWQVGRTGQLTPVLNFDPVQLAGTQVARATGHNLGNMQRDEITEGTKIRIIKSGKIIPYVVEVVGGKRGTGHPRKCPSCHSQLSVIDGSGDNKELVCVNTQCPAQAVRGLAHYLTTLGVKGLGESTVEKLVASGVKTPVDFYKLTLSQLQRAGLSERQSLLVLAAVHMLPRPKVTKMKDNGTLAKWIQTAAKTKKRIPLGVLIAAFGVPTVGNSTGKALVSHFRTFSKIRRASLDSLLEVEDIGELTAKRIREFFKLNAAFVDEILEFVAPEGPKTGKLTGKTFVFTGGLPNGKDYWKAKVENEGGKVTGSVSKATSYVVVGDNPGSKADKAAALQVTTLDVDSLQKLF